MATEPSIATSILLLVLFLTTSTISSASPSSDDLVAELVSLRASSPSGVIHLNDASVSRFLSTASTPRPYSILIFFDASQLRSKPELHLRELRSEFGILSDSFSKHNPTSSRIFFAEIEFMESQASFAQFGVNSLPHVRLVEPNHRALKDSDPMDQGYFSRLAESMSEFVESRTGLEVGPIIRPPPLSRSQVVALVVIFLISMPFMVKKVIQGETLLHDQKVWMGLAIFVYYFSVSGTMHGIIRGSPLFVRDRNDPDRLVFFYEGSGMQLGAEGFAVGFLYIIVGLMIAFVTHGLVRVRNVVTQRMFMLVAMAVGFWAVKKVIYLDNWKTGYAIHTYWPKRWR
ncbi:Oligosaccharyltransferase complex/magnesium transporter family protein [Rhynchospora pubera]|uniref:Oligosaccharyltransferase complex/magnesium transporter family protein n=1 Tax=Rhynchospora pubera TaxID=906938 RepID=A0AAV8HL23_9POAL|nr:Oligosaccharyltransferase complex/magnesium transporter family protein [Rhynchospora pubera]